MKYILLGIQKSLFEKEDPKYLYDNKIGFGIAPEIRVADPKNAAWNNIVTEVKEFMS